MVISEFQSLSSENFGPSGSPDKSAREIATQPFSPAENLEELSEGVVRVERPILDLTKS